MSVGDAGLWAVVAMAAVVAVRPRWSALMPLAAVSATLLVVGLGRLFAVEAWRWAYVVDHARPGTNPFLRIAGLWAGAEGSLLLWTAMVAWAAVIAMALARVHERAATTRAGAALVGGYALVAVLVASPFERLAAPANGGLGLQPVLEHPAMVWHPPLLYAGLVGLLVPFLLAVGLASGADGPSPVDGSRRSGSGRGPFGPAYARSTAVALGLLTAGLVTGALWANVELGWGGFWAWDPIESAGLVAWLAGAAALHAAGGDGGRRTLTALALAPGLSALAATTITRIGVVASVHAFADRPALRLGLLLVAGTAFGVAAVLVVAAGRGPGHPLPSGPSSRRRPARAVGRRHAAVVLGVAALFVAVGTYEPAVEAATTGDRLAIAGRYYTRLLWPLVVVGGGLAVWADGRRRRGGAKGRGASPIAGAAAATSWWPALVGAGVGVVVVPLSAGPFALVVGAVGGAIGGSALAAAIAHRRPGAVAHLGVGIALIGVAGTVATTSTVVQAPADRPLTVDGMTVTHRSIELSGTDVAPTDPEGLEIGTQAAVARVEIEGVAYRPSLVVYPRRGASTAEIARRADGVDEIQVVLLDGDAGAARYRINRLPRVRLVWLGAWIVAGGLLVGPARHLRRRLRASSSATVEPDSPSPEPSSEPPSGLGSPPEEPAGADPDVGCEVGAAVGGDVGAGVEACDGETVDVGVVADGDGGSASGGR